MNKKTVVIHQPDFMPYLGFFQRLLQCDLYIALDHVQFSRGRAWHHRDKIKTPEGIKWLTLPIRFAGNRLSPIREALLNDQLNWREEHLHQIIRCYSDGAGFDEIFPELQQVYAFQCERMVDFNLHALKWLMTKFGITVPMALSSELAPRDRSNEMLVSLLTKVGATAYLSGVGALDYFKPEPFDAADIRVIWQNFTHPVYHQLHGEFAPYLSSLDLLLNCGTEKSREILRSCL